MSDPQIGEIKVGDLAGIQVYKFRMGGLLCLVAIEYLTKAISSFLWLGRMKISTVILSEHSDFYSPKCGHEKVRAQNELALTHLKTGDVDIFCHMRTNANSAGFT